jgi:uncharacterized protein (TIGR02145 family)
MEGNGIYRIIEHDSNRQNLKGTIPMINIKTSLVILSGISCCLADISGIVSDTGSVPISGAVVQLEKGGQRATTGADGRFTLSVNITGITVRKNILITDNLSVKMQNGVLCLNVLKKSKVEVITFDLKGQVLFTVRREFDAGSHLLSIPYRKTGIYLCKVKSGNKEVLLRGNSAGERASEGPRAARDVSSNPKAKQAQATAAMNDVIAVAKTGYLKYRMAIGNPDTSGIAIRMIVEAGTVTDTEGNVYQTVKFGNQVWMAENLRVTKYNDGSAIPFDTAKVTWMFATTPKYCFLNNTTDSLTINTYGAFYNWYVVDPANPRKIAPAGWHVPTDSEWVILEKYLVLNGNNWDGTTDTSHINKIAKSMAAQVDWKVLPVEEGAVGIDVAKNNRSGFSGLPCGYRDRNGNFYSLWGGTYWWCATEHLGEDAWNPNLRVGMDYFRRDYSSKSCGCGIRLVKD